MTESFRLDVAPQTSFPSVLGLTLPIPTGWTGFNDGSFAVIEQPVTGARIRVPEHIQRIDTHSTHGWQMRYGQPTLFFSDGQGPGNGPRPALKRAIDLQMNQRKTCVIEIMCTRELGDPFRRDALAKPVRFLEKYKDYV